MMRVSIYSDDDLLQHAKHFASRKAWEAYGVEEVANGKPSHHRVALKRGIDFYRKCCAHMPDERGGSRGYRYSDEELLASARQYQTRNEWKTKARRRCETARLRPIWDECVAHMRPATNPFAKDYIIYAYEFSDGSVYVGLTFVECNRKVTHLFRGPVFDHAEMCPDPVYKVLESGLSYNEVGAAEDKWQAAYTAKGWTPLWTAKAGSLGGMHRKWTREAVMAEAKKYQTRQEWIDKSQMSYRIAKREGWFDEASAHMPKRKLGVGAGRTVSRATRDKQSAAKSGKTQSGAAKMAKSAAIKQ